MELVDQKRDWHNFVLKSLCDELWQLIENAPQLCDYPTFLLTALVSLYVHTLVDYCVWHCDKRIYDLEEQVGVTRIGILHRDPPHHFLADKTVRQAQTMSWKQLVDLSCRLGDTMITIKASEWGKDCVSFLIESTQVISKANKLRDASNSILEMLGY